MKKIGLLCAFSVLILLTSCTTQSGYDAVLNYDTTLNPQPVYMEPKGGKPVFLSITEPVSYKLDKEATWEECLNLAGKAASQYELMFARAISLEIGNERDTGSAYKLILYFDGDRGRELASEMKILKKGIDKKGNGYTLSVWNDGKEMPKINVPKNEFRGKPEWVTTPPKFDGFYTTVGTSTPLNTVEKSFIYAEKYALMDLLMQLNSDLASSTVEISENGIEIYYKTKDVQVSETAIRGFYILARWYDRKNDLYHSLAVCRKD